MGYRELALPAPRPTLTVDGKEHDVDFFGMDDGFDESPGSAFRFLFQLGFGLMIHLYVIQAGGRGRHGAFGHSYWLKDCAVAEVEPKEYGPPGKIHAAPCRLPLNYVRVVLRDERPGGAPDLTFGLASQTFRAPSAEEMEMELAFAEGGRLLWSRGGAWEVEDGSRSRRRLLDQERLLFL